MNGKTFLRKFDITDFLVDTDELTNNNIDHSGVLCELPTQMNMNKETLENFARKVGINLTDFIFEENPETGDMIPKSKPEAREKIFKYLLQSQFQPPLSIGSELPPVNEFVFNIENNRFVKSFNAIEILGKGGFGKVFKAVNNLDATSYAVKQVILTQGEVILLNKGRSKALREIQSLSSFAHPNIVKYYSCWFEETEGDLESSYSEWDGSLYEESIIEDNNVEKQQSSQSTIKEIKTKQSSFDSLINWQTNGKESATNKTYKENKDKQQLSLFIQMEFCSNGTLHDFLQKRRQRTDPFIAFQVFEAILTGLRQIHSKHIIHRDLK